MSNEPRDPDRREFLRRAAQTAGTVPLFLAIGGAAREVTPFERAKKYLKNAKALTSRAREVEEGRRRALALEASTELTEARAAAERATKSERDKLEGPFELLATEIRELLSEG